MTIQAQFAGGSLHGQHIQLRDIDHHYHESRTTGERWQRIGVGVPGGVVYLMVLDGISTEERARLIAELVPNHLNQTSPWQPRPHLNPHYNETAARENELSAARVSLDFALNKMSKALADAGKEAKP